MADIRVNIHTPDGRVETIEAPASIPAEEFLRDLGGALRLPHLKWIIFDKDANLEIDPKKTLEENRVQAGDHLYLSEARVTPPPQPAEPAPPPPPPPKPETIQCPKCGGQNTVTSRFCSLCGTSLTLAPPDIKLHIHTPDGRSHPIEVSVDLDVAELVLELTKAGIIPASDPQRRAVRWAVIDRDRDLELQQGISLKEAGIAPGHHLYVTEQREVVPRPVEPLPVPPPPLPAPDHRWVKVVVGILVAAIVIGLAFYLYRPKTRKIGPHPPPRPPAPRPVPKGKHADALPALRQMHRLEVAATPEEGPLQRFRKAKHDQIPR